MVALDDGSGTVGLAALDYVGHFRVDLQDPLLPVLVLHAPHAHVLQRYDALVEQYLLVCHRDEKMSSAADPVGSVHFCRIRHFHRQFRILIRSGLILFIFKMSVFENSFENCLFQNKITRKCSYDR